MKDEKKPKKEIEIPYSIEIPIDRLNIVKSESLEVDIDQLKVVSKSRKDGKE